MNSKKNHDLPRQNTEESHSKNKVEWWHLGISFGILMYVFTIILCPLIFKEDITLKSLLIGIPAWSFGGFLYGLTTKWFNKKNAK